MKRKSHLFLLIVLVCGSCVMQRKLTTLSGGKNGPGLAVSGEAENGGILNTDETESVPAPREGNPPAEAVLMKAIEDDDGDMVANETLAAAKVVARFRNVAERNGRVSLTFDITVPAAVLDSRWQLRMTPVLHCLGDSSMLEPVIVTGSGFRKTQLRGYQQYERFLASISGDSTRLTMRHQLDMFVKRNLPGLYVFRNDSSFVSDSEFRSSFGVSGKEAAEHYTRWYVTHRLERRLAERDRRFRKYVRTPLDDSVSRIDTIVDADSGELLFRYRHSMSVDGSISRIDLSLKGSIRRLDGKETVLPYPETISFYISSLSTLADKSPKYMTVVKERRVSANEACRIEFRKGRAEMDTSFSGNARESARIRRRLLELLTHREYDLDSIVVSAGSSPEGSERLNRQLSARRAKSVSEFFAAEMDLIRDSVIRADGLGFDMDGNSIASFREIAFDPKNSGENWAELENLVMGDTSISAEHKLRFSELLGIADADRREERLRKESFFPRIEEHYPKLRTVRFDFHLHRKGMVKDTVHTSVPDSVYMRGVAALEARDYPLAESILRPYRDYNSALAHCAMDHSETALAILEECREDGRVCYLKAVLHGRKGDYREAERLLRKACESDRSYLFRANLDPELSGLTAGTAAD